MREVIVMRNSLLAAGVIAAVLTTAFIGTASPAGAASKATYYVSLGDSAAAGFQPPGEDARGYADQLYQRVKPSFQELRLVKLGCPGETTESLISGIDSLCTYQSGSQLDEATSFLLAHRSQIAFITIDIGVNDILGACFDDETGVLHLACVQGVMPDVRANLATIIETLQAASPGVPMAGMSYWDPFLGFWILGPEGQALAHTDDQGIQAMNTGLVSTYQDEAVLVADVAGPEFFNIADFTDMVSTRWGEVPVNVAKACTWTWFCHRPPLGPDPHPNTKGYGVIADAFAAVLPL
jgi:lysophospholipase L1-like esterase